MKTNFAIVALLMLMGVVACSSDDSDRDNDIVSLVTVVEEGGYKLFERADGVTLYPMNFNIISNTGQRILVEYGVTNIAPSPLYDYVVVVDDFDIVLTKDIVNLTTTNEETIGNDAFLDIISVGSRGGYIDIYLAFLYNYNPHIVNLVYNEITPPINEPDSLNFELRQNANGENVGIPTTVLVSFDAAGYIEAAKGADVVDLTISISALLPNSTTKRYNIVINTETLQASAYGQPSLNDIDIEEGAVQ